MEGCRGYWGEECGVTNLTKLTVSCNKPARLGNPGQISRLGVFLVIRDIPSPKDYESFGFDFINLAWRSTMDLLLGPTMANSEDELADEKEFQEQYWRAAQRPLATAASLVQQGVEFLLKSRIAAVSPYLLIPHSPSDWPSGSARRDVPFGDFKTVDAIEMILLHDAVCANRLSDTFKEKFQTLRVRRNAIMHGVSGSHIKPGDIVVDVLEVTDELVGHGQWLTIRRGYMETEPNGILAGWTGYVEDYVAWMAPIELSKVIEVMTPEETLRLLDFSKKQRRYICPICTDRCRSSDYAADLEPAFALLTPNLPTSTSIRCHLCYENTLVERRDCRQSGCKGNVIDADRNICLTCYEEQ